MFQMLPTYLRVTQHAKGMSLRYDSIVVGGLSLFFPLFGGIGD